MAVAIEFVNVIVRKSAVESCFPGGLDGFARQDLCNLTEDEHLLRVGFMSGSEASDFVSELEAAGLRYVGPVAESDIAVVNGGTLNHSRLSCPRDTLIGIGLAGRATTPLAKPPGRSLVSCFAGMNRCIVCSLR